MTITGNGRYYVCNSCAAILRVIIYRERTSKWDEKVARARERKSKRNAPNYVCSRYDNNTSSSSSSESPRND